MGSARFGIYHAWDLTVSDPSGATSDPKFRIPAFRIRKFRIAKFRIRLQTHPRDEDACN